MLDITVFEEYKAAEARVAAFFIALQAEIKSLPDNPNLKRIAIGGNAFVMSSAHLSTRSWSPEFYDFKWQYQAIAELVANANKGQEFASLLKVLKERKIVKTYNRGSKWKSSHTTLLNDEVCANVTNILKTIGITNE